MITATHRRRLLVVDDEPTIRFAVSEYFESLGFLVDCVADRESACDAVAHHRYDVAIVDLRLSGTDNRDGMDVMRQFQTLVPPLRSIVLSAYGSGDLAEFADLGVVAFFKKPTPLPVIADAVFALTADEQTPQS